MVRRTPHYKRACEAITGCHCCSILIPIRSFFGRCQDNVKFSIILLSAMTYVLQRYPYRSSLTRNNGHTSNCFESGVKRNRQTTIKKNSGPHKRARMQGQKKTVRWDTSSLVHRCATKLLECFPLHL